MSKDKKELSIILDIADDFMLRPKQFQKYVIGELLENFIDYLQKKSNIVLDEDDKKEIYFLHAKTKNYKAKQIDVAHIKEITDKTEQGVKKILERKYGDHFSFLGGEQKTDKILKEASRKVTEDYNLRISLHAVSNIIGAPKEPSLFSKDTPLDYVKSYGTILKNSITEFGINLTDTQLKLMEGILLGFSQTNYAGNIEPKEKKDLAKDEYKFGVLPAMYDNVTLIPRIRVSQREIMILAGININSIASWERGLEAIRHLGTKQFYFYYERTAKNRNGKFIKDEKGKYKKEEVYAVDTLFKIKDVTDKATGRFLYYEIEPSGIFLDQIENYFLLIPYNWREEIKELKGDKKVSAYLVRFLYFLIREYEIKRRKNAPYVIKYSWEMMADTIKMPQNFYKNQKKRANIIIEDAYKTALELGYLKSYKRTEVDELILNPEKYYTPKKDKSAHIKSK